MPYNPDIHNRRSVRLKHHDYSQNGAYFITICVHNRCCLFGNILNDAMILSDAGKMIDEQWQKITTRFEHVCLDEYIIMPNHFHGILTLHGETQDRNLRQKQSRMKTSDTSPCYHNSYLSGIIRAFKSITTHHYIHGVKSNSWAPFERKLWQRNYHEHVIRNETSLQKLREYTKNNPYTWQGDSLFSKDATF